MRDHALDLHTSARPTLPKLLRLYDELGRAFVGGIDDANHLRYPMFDADAHSALELHVQRFERNPPVLHRKELFVASDYPARPRFVRLTQQEERWDLYDGSTGSIGNRDQWAERLRVAGVRIIGHRLLRQ